MQLFWTADQFFEGFWTELQRKNPITGATFCIFERNQKLLDIVEFWSECRNKFKDYDEAGNRIEHEAGDA